MKKREFLAFIILGTFITISIIVVLNVFTPKRRSQIIWENSETGMKKEYITLKNENSVYSKFFGGVIITGMAIFVITKIANQKIHEEEAEIIYDRMKKHEDKLEFEPEIYEGLIEQKVQAVDKFFNRKEFNEFARMVFIKIQQATTKRDWSGMEPFETNELLEQHIMKAEEFKNNKTIKVLDKISILYSKLYRFEQENGQDVLTVIVKVKMKDYTVNETTKTVIEGKHNVTKIRLYIMEFVRKTGVKTAPQGKAINAINCPNCGAPTKITTAGQCEYCGSIIKTEEYTWTLRSYEPFK